MGIRRGYLEQFYPCKGSLAPKSLTTPALPEDWELFPDGLSLGKAKMSLVDNENVFFEKNSKNAEFLSYYCFYCADCSRSLRQGKPLLPSCLKNWENGTR